MSCCGVNGAQYYLYFLTYKREGNFGTWNERESELRSIVTNSVRNVKHQFSHSLLWPLEEAIGDDDDKVLAEEVMVGIEGQSSTTPSSSI